MADNLQLLSADDLLGGEPETVEVPLLGKKVIIRPLTLEETQRLQADAIKIQNGQPVGVDQVKFYKGAVLASLVSPRLDRAQIDLLWTRKPGEVRPLIQAIDRINRLGEEAAEDAEAAFPAK